MCNRAGYNNTPNFSLVVVNLKTQLFVSVPLLNLVALYSLLQTDWGIKTI
ncbi:MAG: hypothetical protein WA667_08550 [Candidatus Nitrosopolaris sp.]